MAKYVYKMEGGGEGYKMSHYTFNALSATSLLAANLAKQTDPIKYSLKSTTPWFSYKISNTIT